MARLCRHALIQAVAALLAWMLIAPAIHPWNWALLQGACAAILSLLLRRGAWGIAGNFVFMPLAIFVLRADIPAWVFFLAFVLTFSLSRNALLERVPLYRSSRQATKLLASEIGQGSHVLDAGAGDGRLALQLALARPDLHIIAMENAWGSWLLAQCRWMFAGRPGNLKFECRNFWRDDWGRYDVVYVFLSPAPMKKVWEKYQQQGKAGGVLISNTFEVPGIDPDRRVPLGGPLQHDLLFWCAAHGTE
jgi:hypothetical protein